MTARSSGPTSRLVLSRLVGRRLTATVSNKDKAAKDALVKLDEEIKNYSNATKQLFASSSALAARSSTATQGYELVNSIVTDLIKST